MRQHQQSECIDDVDGCLAGVVQYRARQSPAGGQSRDDQNQAQHVIELHGIMAGALPARQLDPLEPAVQLFERVVPVLLQRLPDAPIALFAVVQCGVAVEPQRRVQIDQFA